MDRVAAWLACCLLCSLADGYDIQDRWTSTKTDGFGIQRGDAITLTWSLVPDGESYSRAGSSNLIDYLDDGWNVAAGSRTPDLTNRPWWDIMRRVYDQYTRVSGLTMVYVPEQTPGGVDTGASGDIRIGGSNIDNDPGKVLADNSFPNNGDMRIDTSRTSSGAASFWHSNPAQLRNLISHESGHGVGLSHSDISGANAVMETPLETGFWGLQFDDIYAFNRLYGDPLEKNGGNDSSNSAFDLGSLVLGSPVIRGADANDSVVGELDADWLGVDGSNDDDWFRFTTTSTGSVSLTLTPLGPTYSTEEQGPNTDFSARSDLGFELYGGQRNGLSLLADIDQAGAGQAESLMTFALPTPGDYYFRVRGEQDQNQFYEFELSFSDVTGVLGDVNQDGELDELDIAAFTAGWLSDTSGLSQSERTLRGDLNLSGRTDLSDAVILRQALFAAGMGAGIDFAGLAVPEPGSVAMLGFSAMLIIRSGRSRSRLPLAGL